MTSLSEAYGSHEENGRSLRRLYLGTGLFLVGALLVVVGILSATTQLLTGVGVSLLETRRIAGALAGLGIPAVFVGVFTVLPASRRVRAAAAIGASVAVLGVALFWHAFGTHWYGDPTDLTLPVVAVYFFGVITTFWCLFIGIANFKERNDPGGTVNLEVTREGETRIVEVERAELADGFGGVGAFGDAFDGEVETQTNRPDRAATASDGGATAQTVTSPLDETGGAEVVDDSARPSTPQDRYCGNCTHFEYVRTARGIQPYCGFRGEDMDDMDACEEWTPNR